MARSISSDSRPEIEAAPSAPVDAFVDQGGLQGRRDRIHAIVEGALLGDIAIVFLLMRVYLPLPPVRSLIAVIASIPIVMLTQRRGVRMAILACVASYILFSALVGPLLAIAMLNIGLAGVLVGIGRRIGLPAGVNVLWTGIVYALLDVVVPAIASIYVFRYPIKDFVQGGQNFVKVSFNLIHFVATGGFDRLARPAGIVALVLFAYLSFESRGRARILLVILGVLPSLVFVMSPGLQSIHASPSFLHSLRDWERWMVAHWQVPWLTVTVLYGLLQMYLVVLVSDMVLKQIPEHTLRRQRKIA